MPIKLIPPREGKTPYYSGRGTYLGVYVDRTTKASELRQAQRVIGEWKRAIERGEFSPKPVAPERREPTFADAALAYLRAGGDGKFLSRIIEQAGEHALRDRLLKDIDQIAIDNAAIALYPHSSAQTRNRQFYTPVSAVLKRAGMERQIKRPSGWRGNKSQSWLEPEQAFALIDAAYKIDEEFGLFCLTLLYTGMRLSEALNIRMRHLSLDNAMVYLPDTKNGSARPVHLPPIVVKALKAMPARVARPRKADGIKLERGQAGRSRLGAGRPFLSRDLDARLFRFHVGGHLRDMLSDAMRKARLSFPRRQGGFHIFCHTYGTWMASFGNLDTMGLVRTKRWKDPESADRYHHTRPSEEARRADLLPTKIRGVSVERKRHAKKG
jgi:integrase